MVHRFIGVWKLWITLWITIGSFILLFQRVMELTALRRRGGGDEFVAILPYDTDLEVLLLL